MKFFKYIAISSLLGFFCLVLPLQAEEISDFAAVFTIASDGTIEVTETILYDFQGKERYGMLRTIEKPHPQAASGWYKTRYIELELQHVMRNGKPEPYFETSNQTQTVIRIGDPLVTLTGSHAYTIVYKLIGALSYNSEEAEFFYNVISQDWGVPIKQVTAIVTAYNSAVLGGTYSCYVGEVGSQTCHSSSSEPGTVTFTAENISPGSGVIIAAEVDQSAVAVLITEHSEYVLIGWVLAVIWIFGVGIAMYRFRTQSKVDKTIIAQYEPYNLYPPMYTGVLMGGKLDAHGLVAGILYLAEQGFIKIKRTKKKISGVFVPDFKITLLKSQSEIPTQFLLSLIKPLFNATDEPGVTVLLSSLNDRSGDNNIIFQSLSKDIKEDILEDGYTTAALPKFSVLVYIILAGGGLLFSGFAFVENGLVLLMVVVSLTIGIGSLAFMERLTTKGYEARNHIAGFKLFLSITDKEQFDIHNAAEINPEIFIQYLPYAVALKLEEKWAEVFKDVAIPPPEWYEDSSKHNFSALVLTSNLINFYNSFTDQSSFSTA